MGRPKKEMPPSKGRKFTIRLTDVMYESLEQDAVKAGLSVSEYARELLLNNRPVVKHEIVFDSEELLHVLGDMGKIGSNLNQIAHHLNGGGGWSANLKSEVLQGVIAIYKIRDMVKEMAGEYRGGN
jgi:hypothetical protein